jgi:copper(I)-binding protein
VNTHRTPHRPLRRSRGRTAIALLAFLAPTALLAACGDDDDSDADGTTPTGSAAAVEITDAWARTSPAMATAGAVYMQIENAGEADDALIGVAVDPSVAATAELHETTTETGEPEATGAPMDTMSTMAPGTDAGMPSDTTAMGGGMMTMRPVERIDVPAGETVALEPGGYHVMLLDLAAPLEVGATVEVTLTFESAGTQVVTADVRDA